MLNNNISNLENNKNIKFAHYKSLNISSNNCNISYFLRAENLLYFKITGGVLKKMYLKDLTKNKILSPY